MRRNRQNGQALVLVALSLLVLVGIVGLSIDMGYLRYAKRRLQTAADSAAIAGASELKDGNYKTAAVNDARVNGFDDGVNGVTVTSFNPPKDAPFNGKPNANEYVEVQVKQDAPTFFMRIFGVKSAALSATAVAQLGSSKGCVYALGLLGGITVNGTVNAPDCGVIDNAILSIGGGCITASSIGVVLQLLGGGCVNPQPILGIAPSADPLGYLTPPGGGNCTFTNKVVNSKGAPTVLTPGTYCGGIRILNGNTAPVTFQPGLYILTGGTGLQVGGSGDVSGVGVTFYITGGGTAQINGTGNVTLSAPTNSPSPGVPGGVLFYQDRGDAQNPTLTGNLNLSGALYFPSATLTLGGNVSSTYAIIVAQIIQFNGNVGIGANFTSLPSGSPVKAAVLVQ
jgi:hypothetical protein